MKKLARKFYTQPTLQVAEQLLGKILVFDGQQGIITETEAYIGTDDPACHAARGMTPRNQVMFGPAGYSYVYFIYGMHFCLNVITEKENFPAAVLIRGVRDLETGHHYDGPAKLCKFYGINKENNQHDLTKSDHFYILETNKKVQSKKTPRIGIKQGTDKLWRFVLEE